MANTYLSRSTTSGTDTIWTWSGWIKRSKLGTSQTFFGTGNGSSSANSLQIRFDDYDKIDFRDFISSNYNGRLQTNRRFRDTSAWYHFVFVWDTTQASATNRMKIYVNGVQETSFADQRDAGQNTSAHTSGSTTYIGTDGYGGSTYFDGLMSHVHFIDGIAYTPSAFGETDATTGEWKAKTSPSVTYGNNGFFILKDGNGITDQSGEGNDFTLGGGTLTDLKDNPDNTFATWNPLNQISSVSYTNGNNTFTNSTGTGNRLAFPTLAMTSGKFYCEMKVVNLGTAYTHIGLRNINSYTLTNAYVNEPANEKVSYLNDGRVFIHGGTLAYDGTTYTTGDIIGMACDMDNGYLYYHKNGTYINSGSPTSGATGTGGFDIYNHGTIDYCFAVSNSGDSSPPIISANFGNGYFGTTAVSSAGTNASDNGIFEYDVPTGYTALSTKGLNL